MAKEESLLCACEVLEVKLRTEASGEAEEQIAVCKNALEKLLRSVQELSDTEGGLGLGLGLESGVTARLVVVAAGHSGSHYWTNAANRKLANGKDKGVKPYFGVGRPTLVFEPHPRPQGEGLVTIVELFWTGFGLCKHQSGACCHMT